MERNTLFADDDLANDKIDENQPVLPDGMKRWRGYYDLYQQQEIIKHLRKAIKKAPLYQLFTPGGRPMSVRMTNFGKFGWMSDKKGYRYEPYHPITAKKWPEIPTYFIDLWHEKTGLSVEPDCCLLNLYLPNETKSGAKMGLHQDKDEQDFSAPVLSISLGDAALFSYTPTGRKKDGGKIWLRSGDILLFGGVSRLIHHGIDKVDWQSGPTGLMQNNMGRINLTMRKVLK